MRLHDESLEDGHHLRRVLGEAWQRHQEERRQPAREQLRVEQPHKLVEHAERLTAGGGGGGGAVSVALPAARDAGREPAERCACDWRRRCCSTTYSHLSL